MLKHFAFVFYEFKTTYHPFVRPPKMLLQVVTILHKSFNCNYLPCLLALLLRPYYMIQAEVLILVHSCAVSIQKLGCARLCDPQPIYHPNIYVLDKLRHAGVAHLSCFLDALLVTTVTLLFNLMTRDTPCVHDRSRSAVVTSYVIYHAIISLAPLFIVMTYLAPL